MSMMGSNSAHGAAYEPLAAEGGYEGYEGPASSMMQGQYPAGAAMGTFGGGTAFGAAPPSHGGMQAMEGAGFTKGPGETHGGHEGHEGGSHEGHASIDKETGRAPRRCTDVLTCFLFLAFSILAFTLLGVAAQHGNTGRLTHGTDYYGRVCGVDAGVENMPFLFWCRKDAPSDGAEPADLDLDAPSCVPYCPASNNAAVKIPCLKPEVAEPSYINGPQFGNVKTLVLKTQESVVLTVPYATSPRGGRYCIPTSAVLADKILNDSKALGPWSHARFLTVVGTLRHLWWILAATSALSIALGYLFIFCIKHCPYQIAKVFLLPSIVLTMLSAVGFFLAIVPLIPAAAGSGFVTEYMQWNPMYAHWNVQQASGISIALGFVCLCWFALFGGMAYNFKSTGVTDLINTAFETFRAVPAMKYIPMFEGIAKFIVFWVGLQGFSVFVSEGFLKKNRIHVNGAKYAGLSREFVPSTQDWRFWAMAIVWIVFFFIMIEFCTAMGQFVTTYCTFKYYGVKKEKGKKGKVEGGAVCQGLRDAMLYHPGSLLKAAMTVIWYRPYRLLHWASSEFVGDGQTPKGIGGKFLHTITMCGCRQTAEKIQKCTKASIEADECPTKDAFGDVVIRANDFDAAVGKAHDLLEHSHKIVKYIYQDHSQTTLNVVGVLSISGISAITTYLLVANLDVYSDPISALYVADPILVTFISWALSAYIAFGFMTLWDHTADTLLYCYAWSRRWDRATVDKYIPESLRYIVGFDDMDADRYPYYGKAKNNMYLRYWLPMVGMEDPKKAQKGPQKVLKTSVMETHAPSGIGMGRRPASKEDGSWMSGFGTGFGAWGRQEQAVSGPYNGDAEPLMA